MKNEVTIKNGNLDLFISNSIIINANEPTTLKLAGDENESMIEMVFKFENRDENEKKPGRQTNVINDTKMEIIFINFNNVLGTYSSSIWELGTLKKRKLFLYYSVRDFAKSEMKQFDFTFYLGEEVQNG
ncbi:MAG: DUF6864 domain-containing function [Flavobacteriaceae bacterium]